VQCSLKIESIGFTMKLMKSRWRGAYVHEKQMRLRQIGTYC
jgi:hypothetical protein